jgi:hypothetical protein
MYVLSRKVKASIERCLFDIFEGRFAEPTIKELLVDLRELAFQFPTGKGDEPKLDQAITDFVDVCNFVAHPNKDRGNIAKRIKTHAEKIADAIAKGGDEVASEILAVEHIIHGDTIVAGMLGFAFRYLSSFKKDIQRDSLLPAWERRNDIALCIISILQDATIRLKNEKWSAHLHVVSYEGYYRLYCSILGSRVDQDARARTGGTGHVVIGFPVIVTGALDIDGVLPKATGLLSILPDVTQLHPIVETYRRPDGSLHVRAIENS